MDSKLSFARCCANKRWRASLSQHRIKPHPLGWVKDILHEISPCYFTSDTTLLFTAGTSALCYLQEEGFSLQMQAAVLGELLCPKNVSFASEVEKPEGGSSASAPYTCTSHMHAPTYPLLCSVMDCSCTKIKGGELKARVERKRRKLTNKAINAQ